MNVQAHTGRVIDGSFPKMKTIVLALVVSWALLAILAALNWGELGSAREVSLGIASVTVPLALLVFGPALLLTALYVGAVAALRIGAHLQARHHHRELQASRTLADEAEASRYTALRSFLEEQSARQAQLNSDLLARIDRQEQTLRTAIDQAGDTLAAYIGEIEDRLAGGERLAGDGR